MQKRAAKHAPPGKAHSIQLLDDTTGRPFDTSLRVADVLGDGSRISAKFVDPKPPAFSSSPASTPPQPPDASGTKAHASQGTGQQSPSLVDLLQQNEWPSREAFQADIQAFAKAARCKSNQDSRGSRKAARAPLPTYCRTAVAAHRWDARIGG